MKANSRAWLTSFGDLLTLLLCFFVLAIYQGGKNAQAKAQAKQALSSLMQINFTAPATPGKEIASKEMTEFPHWVLVLKKDSFSSGYIGFNERAATDLKDFLEKTEGQIQVEFCSLGFDYAPSVAEMIEQNFGARQSNLLIGAKACRELKAVGSEITKDTIQLSAKAKPKNG